MNEDQSSFEDRPVADHNLISPKAPLWKRRNVQLILAFVILMLVGIGALAFSGDSPAEESAQETENQFTDSPVQQVDDASHPAELLYAYWEDDTVRVRTRDWKSGERQEIFDYRTDNFDSTLLELGWVAGVAYDPNKQSFLYSDSLGIQVLGRDGEEPSAISLKEPAEVGGTPTYDWLFSGQPIRATAVQEIQYSRDGTLAAIHFDSRDGSSTEVVDISSRQLVNSGDTSRSDQSSGEGETSLTPNQENAVFRTMGNMPNYFFTPSGATISGYGAFSPDATLAGLLLKQQQADLVIASADGNFTKLGSGDYLDEIVFSKDGTRLFAVKEDGNDFLIEEWGVGGMNLMNTYNVKDSFVIPGSIESVRLYSFDTVYASVRSAKSPSDFAQFVVDVAKQDQLAEFVIDRLSVFSVLYSKQ